MISLLSILFSYFDFKKLYSSKLNVKQSNNLLFDFKSFSTSFIELNSSLEGIREYLFLKLFSSL